MTRKHEPILNYVQVVAAEVAAFSVAARQFSLPTM